MSELGWPIISLFIGGTLIAFLALYLFKIRRELKAGYPLKDERTERITGKAAMGTYYVTLFFLVAQCFWILLGYEVMHLPEIEAGWYSISTMMVMGFSFGILNWYYVRKEEQP
ncbi:hypothetical protein JW865_06365 [Candidatus Bathyarchaeota archaeon]|nr:hypothetical protein [Candidatus Bathyarchaeota archaeon]